MKYIKDFSTVTLKDIAAVGGKNASIGQMMTDLSDAGVMVPDGFAITAQGYWDYLDHNQLVPPMELAMATLTAVDNIPQLTRVGKTIRELLLSGTIPPDLAKEIELSYKELSHEDGVVDCAVAVRSSATAEDLPTASFAGQQETYLNVKGVSELLVAYKKCIASLFTDRAIVYRVEQGFDHFAVGLSVGVQKMVRSDKASSGVAFSLDTESGFKDVVLINASWGLGEAIVQGLVIPDEFVVFKPTLREGYRPIIKKKLGSKTVKIVYDATETKKIAVPHAEQSTFSLRDDEILSLARMVDAIEAHYTRLKGDWSPMDVEWAKDGVDGKIYIVQARPETVYAVEKKPELITYQLQDNQTQIVITSGQSVGRKIVSGVARIITSVKDIELVQEGDILVTSMTDPDWVSVMKKTAGIITDLGGRTCHAAIVSRELGTPAIIGTEDATQKIKNGQRITLDCSKGSTGYVLEGALAFEVKKTAIAHLPQPPVTLMVNLANPDQAFDTAQLPVDGVGLARIEFIFSNNITVHPMALLQPERLTDPAVKKRIEALTAPYKDGRHFFVDTLAQGIGMIAAAFYPRPVVVRLSDFKTNEYRNLLGGSFFEPVEANPMIGFRGASRYYHSDYQAAFELECAAFKMVRDEMGLKNLKIMVPFVRTIDEAKRVTSLMKQYGLERGVDGLRFIMMVEMPSNVLLIEEFSSYFDGFSIGSNDLTQLTLGVDRDSAGLRDLFNEDDESVKRMVVLAIAGAHRKGRPIGICGQAPSDNPVFADFLVEHEIDSLSLNPDSVISYLLRFKK